MKTFFCVAILSLCLVVALAKTDCEKHRDRELKKSQNGFVGNFIPSCEENGVYSRRQCHGSTGYCWCSDENGNRVSEQTRGEVNC